MSPLPFYEGRRMPGEPYLPSPALVEAVRVAQLLHRPLLLKGDPGCGKTRLAKAVARELYANDDEGPVYFDWHVKSTSRARDGLYRYDTVGRLRDAHMQSVEPSEVQREDKYIQYAALGKAFLSERPAVVLIDEIDKADIDFPNDLLVELDEGVFLIEETGKKVAAKHVPLIFITSNDERDLPDAFLRRCVFHYVEFPDRDQLGRIVEAHLPDIHRDLLDAAMKRFHELRTRMATEKNEGGKRVGTSELLDWLRVLGAYPLSEILSRLKAGLPFAGALLKSREDNERFLQTLAVENKP